MIKFAVIWCAIVLAVNCNLTNHDSSVEWSNFKLHYKKSYTNPIEERTRFTIFQNNLGKIKDHNKLFEEGRASFYLKINHLADMTLEEYIGLLQLNYTTSPNKNNSITKNAKNKVHLPDQIDWRTYGAVTPIKNQGSCGSCWSFSVTGALEGLTKIKRGKLISLSEQNLVDCATKYGTEGCIGGYMDDAFQYVEDYGIMSEDSYPYNATDGVCHFNASQSVLKISSYVDITPGSEDELQEAIASVGPVSIGIDASSASFMLYGGGIFDNPDCGTYLNHAVLTVGYGSEDDKEYYIVKNSWGTSWGEKGYIRMSRNKQNQCLIASYASYPVL